MTPWHTKLLINVVTCAKINKVVHQNMARLNILAVVCGVSSEWSGLDL
jgi:hypothetical protein